MNILQALQHHLQQTHAHVWEHDTHTNTLRTTIQTPYHLCTTIIITQHDNTLTITQTITQTEQQTEKTTIDLLDPNFLDKIHQVI